jgi:hypothetical protein
MEQSEGDMMKTTLKAAGALALLGLSAQWAPTLTSLLVIVVILNYAQHAWRTIAKIPARQLGELLLVAGVALGAGLLFKLSVDGLIVTGLFLLVTLPLWRRARHDPREEPEPAGSVEASPGEGP